MASLLHKRQVSSLTETEARALGDWLAEDPSHAALAERLGDPAFLQAETKRFLSYVATEVWDHPELGPALRQDRKPWLFRRWLPYVAAVVLALGIGAWLLYGDRVSVVKDRPLAAEEILPGGNRATLTLADGRVINLDEAQTGIVVGTEAITYQDGSSLNVMPSAAERSRWGQEQGAEGSIKPSQPNSGDGFTMLSLTTPTGGTYQITLPDGSKVWLNAASTIKYPGRFDGDARNVEISGEAYFSVVSDSSRPFKVTSNGQTVEVLGTEFNVSAYPDENETKTTLVQGKVRVVGLVAAQTPKGSPQVNVAPKEANHAPDKSSVTISPGQQAITRGTSITVSEVDVFDYTAWRDGMIVLSGARLQDVIRQLERWYDVTVELPDSGASHTAYVMINRNEKLSSVLKALEETYRVKLKLEGRRVSVID